MNTKRENFWECPNKQCKYLIPQNQYRALVHDFNCPRCQQTRMSSFNLKPMEVVKEYKARTLPVGPHGFPYKEFN